MKLIGYEGLFAGIMYMFLLFGIQFINCSNEEMCPDGKLDNIKIAFQMYADRPLILIFSILLMFSEAFYNTLGASVTKYASSAQR